MIVREEPFYTINEIFRYSPYFCGDSLPFFVLFVPTRPYGAVLPANPELAPLLCSDTFLASLVLFVHMLITRNSWPDLARFIIPLT